MAVCGVILAGGRGLRMGAQDKGLVTFRQQPMVAHVIERFAPQVDTLLINANRHLPAYADFGYPVIPDAMPDFAGPLAGLQAALAASQHDLVATVPCDTPFIPSDLVARLSSALLSQQAELAVVVTQDRPQPVFSLCRRALLPALTAFLQQGGRKVGEWHATLKVARVSFDDQPDAFLNINTPYELENAA